MMDILLPQIQKLVSTKTINSLKKNGVKTVASGLYTMLPGPIRLVIKEKPFIDFCLAHQDAIFGKPTPVKKQVKKTPTKKVTQKATSKKIK